MELNRRKYNIFVIVLVVLIASVVIFSAVELSVKEETKNVDLTQAEEVSEETLKEEEFAIVEDKNYLPKVSSFSNGWVALNNAYKVLDNYSYTSTKRTVGKNDPVKIAGFEIVVTQNLSEKKYVTSKEALFVTNANCSNSEGENYYSYTYMDKNSGKVIKRKTENGSFTNEPISSWSVSEFEALTAISSNGLYYKLNSANANLDSFKISGGSYILKISLKAGSSAFKNLEKNVIQGAEDMKDFRPESVSFEISINRKTGAFESIKSVERYAITKKTNIAGWQSSTLTVSSTETFKFANINLESIVNKTVVK